MLNDRYTLLDRVKILCNAKVKYQPQRKSYSLPLTFIALQLVVASLPFALVQFHWLWLLLLQAAVFLAVAGLFASLVLGGSAPEAH